MLIDLLLFIPLKIITFMLTLLPNIPVSQQMTTALTSASASLYALNSFIPVPTLALIVGIIIAYEVAILTLQIFLFIYGKIPFIGR